MYDIDYQFFDLKETAMSLQSFRMKRLGAYSSIRYAVPFNNEFITCEQKHDGRKFFRCGDDKFYDVLWNGFNLSEDNEIIHKVLSSGNKFSKQMAKHSSVRVLKVDPFELSLQLICSRNCSPLKAQAKFDHVLKVCGKRYNKVIRGGYGKRKLWNVPTAKQILKKQDSLEYSILGDQLYQIVELAEMVEEGWLDFASFEELSNKDLEFNLHLFNIFTRVEVERLMLNSYNRLDVFPKSKACVKLVRKAFGTVSLEEALERLRSVYNIKPGSLYVIARTTCLEKLRMLQKGWERWA